MMVQQAGFAPMKVCVFSSELESCEDLRLKVEKAGNQPEQILSEPLGFASFVTDSSKDYLVLIDTRKRFEGCLHLIRDLCVTRPRALVAIVDETDIDRVALVVDAGAQAILVEPVEAADIRAAFVLAAHQQTRQSRLIDDANALRQKLAERKIIEKAKGILMDSAKVSESEAFRLIQKQSQDKRTPMSEVARLIIAASEMVKAAKARAQ